MRDRTLLARVVRARITVIHDQRASFAQKEAELILRTCVLRGARILVVAGDRARKAGPLATPCLGVTCVGGAGIHRDVIGTGNNFPKVFTLTVQGTIFQRAQIGIGVAFGSRWGENLFVACTGDRAATQIFEARIQDLRCFKLATAI